ncbi:MAG: UDP-3-O-(3-hydroxymyristoyl)glucosamine N-acyltransferase [Elusimicrobia bacterium]|nr:UDP-3-O-(3-hydroxymyristoyl)glucosamine N-acyltransferase [Elusimicrobiota bacterium]
MTLQELAAALGLKAHGAPDYAIKGVRDISALSEGQDLEDGFVYFIESQAVLKRHPKAAEHGVVLTTPAMADLFPRALIAPEGRTRLALIALLKKFDRAPRFPAGVSSDAKVDPSATVAASASVLQGSVVMAGAVVGERCVLYPGVVLEPSAVVGDDTVLFPCVVVGHHCVIGKHGIVHGGTVIGSDGFGFHDEPGGRHKIPQIGNVVIGDHVELGSGCTIDRATIESTTIGEHTKLDNQVHIGHNCRLGRYIYIAGNTGLAGSVVVEDGVMISGMVSVRDHVLLAKGTVVMGMSGVAKDTEPRTAYFGTPARPARQTHKMNAALERLPELLARVRRLEDKAPSPEEVGA